MPQTTLVALYRGETIGDARLVAVSADPELVAYVASVLLSHENQRGTDDDPVLAPIERGKRQALRVIKGTGRPRR